MRARIAEDLRRAGCYCAAALVEHEPLDTPWLADAVGRDLEFGTLTRAENGLLLAMLGHAAQGADGEQRVLAAYVAWDERGCVHCARAALDEPTARCADCVADAEASVV